MLEEVVNENASGSVKGIIVVAGIHGSGKSTLSQIGHSDYVVVDRSSESPYAELGKNLDRLVSLHQFEDAYMQFDLPSIMDDHLVYYVILDPSAATAEQRLRSIQDGPLVQDLRVTPKSLQYFKKRFQSVATDFGLPMFDNSNETAVQTMNRIVQFIQTNYCKYRQLALLSLTRDQLARNDLENFLFQHLERVPFTPIIDPLIYIEGMEQDSELAFKLYIKQLVDDPSRYHIEGPYLHVDALAPIPIPDDIILMRAVMEGESKRIYKLVDSSLMSPDYCVILLKSTIYSHSRQSTGEIGGLAGVRAIGTQLMLEMLTRNNIAHTYFSINSEGVIISKWLDDIVPLEIVVKKYCLGTDKHSYYGLAANPELVDFNFKYTHGQYVRFDWRNPNHLANVKGKQGDVQKVNPAESPYYYTIEAHYGKERFFEQFLRQPHVTPLGDKQISEDILTRYADTRQLKKLVLRTFMTIQAYLGQIGLEVQDACFMADRSGQILWSEINQDCMRIVTKNDTDNRYDKDIWRAGGSGAKEILLQKWIAFNQIMMTAMNTSRYAPDQYYTYDFYPIMEDERRSSDNEYIDLYSEMYLEDFQRLHGELPGRDIIVTMDLYNGQPVLVRAGQVYHVHSPSMEVALEKITIFPNLLLVDLNRAIPGSDPAINRELIKQVGLSHYIYTGGGVKTMADVQELLGSSVRRIVIGSNFDPAFLRSIPANRVIIELTVDEHDSVLTHGRTVNTQIRISEFMRTILGYGIDTFSVTFHHSEGLLQGIPRSQILRILGSIPLTQINKLIIAGGIASMDDLEFLWSLPKVVPQVGSLIWKDVVSVGQIYSGLLKFQRRIPTIIQSKTGLIQEITTIDHPTLIQIANDRLYQANPIAKMEILPSRAFGLPSYLVIILDRIQASGQSILKTNLLGMVEHLKSKQDDASSSYAIQQQPELVLAKILEEFHELLCGDASDLASNSSELLLHLLMYLNSKQIPFEAVLNRINAQRWTPSVPTTLIPIQSATIKIGITGAKYSIKTDTFIRDCLGIAIIRPSGRGLRIGYEVINSKLYSLYFSDRFIDFLPCRPKDMVRMMAKNEIQMAITYSTVIENQPTICKQLAFVIDPSIKLCLIRRVGEIPDYRQPIKVACEHPRSCAKYFKEFGIPDFTLDYLTGQSESFMLADTSYHLCDAIVESGSTLAANNLEIHDTIHDNGTIQIGLYAKIDPTQAQL